MSRRLSIPLLALVLLGSLALGAHAVRAQVPLGRLSPSASAWKQIVPLVRERAAAKGKGFDFQPALRIETASGYRVEVTAIGGAIVAIVGRGKGDITAYLARGLATSRRLKADFGRFGRLDMRFRPSPRLAPLPPRHRCRRGIRYPRQRGVWTGGFRFSGEGDYVSVRVHRAAGSIRGTRPVCAHLHLYVRRSASASSGPFSSFVSQEELAAGWRQGPEGADFLAAKLLFKPIFIARSEQTLGSVAIIRLAVARRSGSLLVDDSLTHAEAKPPAPFHGVGVYTASPDGTKAWTGNLTVDFPGAASFPLTGEEFEVEAQRPLSVREGSSEAEATVPSPKASR